MSTITTTAPSSFEAPRTSGRRILVAGAVVAGLVVAGAVAIPRLTAQTTTAPTTYPAITSHDAVEHQLDTARSAALGAAARHQSRAVERNVDLAGKRAAAGAAGAAYVPMEFQPALAAGETRMYVGGQLQTVLIPQVVGSSVVAEQTGTIGHYAYTPPLTTKVYNGSTLETVPVTGTRSFTAAALQAMRQQIGGLAPTYAWTPNHVTSVQKEQTGVHRTYPFTGRTLHMTWGDPWVPPTDNPDWVPYIKSHYFHPVTTRPLATHEYR